ncbi:FkbM family methyltransferase [Azospirillum sp. YIM DDC1]|uniref:FkbM family methyltransferase n=1 Tax=Azospirillum aestuarii TaxID=2802052 RepID=A0ABS1I6Y4_9PROT|nr:FkbM family methyltransferase [Azospirillum aestuarii]MBK4722829.1 FkbM family methyltransferase [Azospirillum aestuarii]
MRTIADVRADFTAGRIPRETFWQEMGEHHLALRQYHGLLEGSEIARLEITAEALHAVTQDGLKFVWDPEDYRCAPTVSVNYRAYEPAESACLLAGCRNSKVVFDIGANIGWYAVHFIDLLRGRGGALHAFEPVPRTFAKLSANVALNGMQDMVRLNNCGLGNKPDTLVMYVPPLSDAASLRNLHPEQDCTKVEVAIDVLDAYCRRNGVSEIDMIKCDVEGAELFVVQGGMDIIAASRPLIFLELLRKWSAPFGYHPNEVIRLLAGVGYECWMLEGGKLVQLREMTDDTVQTNFFFVQPDKHAWFLNHQGA